MNIQFFNDSDIHGRLSNPDYISLVPTQKVRKIQGARKRLFHQTRNGVNDPVTFFHVLDTLMDTRPGQVWRTNHFMKYLRERVPSISWDPVTVGRVLNDMAESLSDAYGFKAIGTTRRFDGIWYDVSSEPEARAALERLLEDLLILSEQELEQEHAGKVLSRQSSPMGSCPSLAL